MILGCVLKFFRVHWSLQREQRNQEREWERGKGKVECEREESREKESKGVLLLFSSVIRKRTQLSP